MSIIDNNIIATTLTYTYIHEQVKIQVNTNVPDSDLAFMQSESRPRNSAGSSPSAVCSAAL